MAHIIVIQVYTTRIAKQHDELLFSILLLLFAQHIYVGMCSGIRSNPHTSIYE